MIFNIILSYVLLSQIFGKDISNLSRNFKIHYRELKEINTRSVESLKSNKDWVITLEKTTAELNKNGFYINPFDLSLGLGLSNVVRFFLDWGNYNVKKNHLLYFDFFDFQTFEKTKKWRNNDFKSKCEKIDFELEYSYRLESYIMEYAYQSNLEIESWRNHALIPRVKRWFEKKYKTSISVNQLHLEVLGSEKEDVELPNVEGTIRPLLQHGGLDGFSLNDFRKIIKIITPELFESLKDKFFSHVVNTDYQILFISLHYGDLDSAIRLLEIGNPAKYYPTLKNEHEVSKFYSKSRQPDEIKEKSHCILLSFLSSNTITKSIHQILMREGENENCEYETIKKSSRILDLVEEKMGSFIPSTSGECWNGYEEELENMYKDNLERISGNEKFKTMVEFMEMISERLGLEIGLEEWGKNEL